MSNPVIYLLDCKPTNNACQWRSAVALFKNGNLDTFNTGDLPDKIVWVTEENVRTWGGFMIDFTFDDSTAEAQHYNHMIFNNTYVLQRPENDFMGWAAKVKEVGKTVERAPLIPIYKADSGELIRLQNYRISDTKTTDFACIRRFFCTLQNPPSTTYAARSQPKKDPPKPCCCQAHHHRSRGHHSITDPNAEGDDDASTIQETETPLDLKATTDVVEPIKVSQDDIPTYEPGSSSDPDNWEGEKDSEQVVFEDS